MTEKPPAEEGGDSLRCEICWESGGGSIIQCSGCKLRVHSACYGSAANSTTNGGEEQRMTAGSNFVCCVCAYWDQLGVRVSPNSLVCSLCNRSGGPMKCGVEGLWVHVACVLYSNDGPVFRNYTARACPMNLQKCLRQRHQCHLCLSCTGFSTKCSFPGCNKRMHITCAFQHHLKPKVTLISAKVPFSMYPESQVDNSESKTVEKIIKIVTCQQHSSQNAQNAIENYEISQLQKTDITRLCQPRVNAGALEQPTPLDVAVAQPPPPVPPNPSAFPPPYGLTNPAAQQPPPGVPPQQQWAYPPQYYYYNQPPMGYYNTWSPHQYGYAQHILQRTAPYPNWGNNQYGMQPRTAQQTTAMTPNANMARVRTTQTNPSPPTPLPKAEPKKKVKAKAQVASSGGLVVKQETSTTSPADLKKKRASTTKGSSNSGGRQKASGDVSAKARDKGKIGGSGRASRLKSSDDYVGCPTTVRGSRVNWTKLEPFMVPMQGTGAAAETTSRLIALLDALQRGAETTVKQAVRWTWVREPDCPPQVKAKLNPTPAPAVAVPNYSMFQQHPYLMNTPVPSRMAPEAVTAPTNEADGSEMREVDRLEILKAIWEARRNPQHGGAAYSVLLSTEQSKEVFHHPIWTFWVGDNLLDFTPLPAPLSDAAIARPVIGASELQLHDQQMRSAGHWLVRFEDDPMTGAVGKSASRSQDAQRKWAETFVSDKDFTGYVLEPLRRQDSGEPLQPSSSGFKRSAAKSLASYSSEAPRTGTSEPWSCASSELIFGFNTEAVKIESFIRLKEYVLERPVRRATTEAFANLLLNAMEGDHSYERRNLSLDVCSWNEVSRLESLFNKVTQSAVFVLLRKVPPELFSSAKNVPTAALKYLQDKENATFSLDASLLKKTASTTKKVYLHSRFWDLNPPIPLTDTRVLLPKNSYSVTSTTSFMEHPPDHIPISDETTREWLTAAQRVRQLRSQQQALGNNSASHQADLSAPDFQKAVRGEEFVKLLSTEQYWHSLLFKDDFVKRQMVSILSVWSKRRARIMGGLRRIRDFVNQERQRNMWICEDAERGRIVLQNAAAANRWSAMRWWMQQGHQDPGQALVDRVKMEHEHRHLIQDGIPPVTGDPNAPGATSSKMYFCMACFAADTDSLNPLSTCMRCGCLAHNSCYAVGPPGQLELESHPWLCDRCCSDKASCETSSGGSKVSKQLTPPPPASCCVCLQFGGCLKRLGPAAFVHVTCAIWVFPIVNCGDWANLTDWHITLPLVKAKDQGGATLFEDDAFLRSRLPEDQVLTAEQIIVMNGDACCSICHSQGLDNISREKPFGSRGLVIKCVEENCNTSFHPICAWLEGFRAHANPNPYKPLTPPSANLGLTALDIYAFCGEHSAYPGRLDLQTLSEHRKRAYCSKTGAFAGSQSTREAAVPALSTTAKKAGPARSETRRPSVTEETENLANNWSVACIARLSTADVYLEGVCQACLGSQDIESHVVCEGCEQVRVHSACDARVLDEQRMCVSCSRGHGSEPLCCFMCPRLGGAFISPTDGSFVHQYCLTAAAGKVEGDIAEAWTSIQQLQTESGYCAVCAQSSGYLVSCEEDGCDAVLHPLCAALIKAPPDDLPTSAAAPEETEFGLPTLCPAHTPSGDSEMWNRLQRDAGEHSMLPHSGTLEGADSSVSSYPPAGAQESEEISPDQRRNKRKRITLFGESSEEER